MAQRVFRSSYTSALGEVLTAYRMGEALVGLSLGGGNHPALERRLVGQFGELAAEAAFPPQLRVELEQYFCGGRGGFSQQLLLVGTPFQQKVWEALLRVPYGSTVSYARLGELAGVRGSRAVGNAVGANPLAILVPCHRVLPRDGSLGNYSAGRGPATKAALLCIEGKTIPFPQQSGW